MCEEGNAAVPEGVTTETDRATGEVLCRLRFSP